MISIIQMGKYMHRNNIVSSVYQNNTTTFPRSHTRNCKYVIDVLECVLFPILFVCLSRLFYTPPFQSLIYSWKYQRRGEEEHTTSTSEHGEIYSFVASNGEQGYSQRISLLT